MSKDRLVLIFSIWLAVLAVQAKPVDPGLVADIHFAGGQAVSADPNSKGLQHVWTSPEALALRTEMVDKLSRAMDFWLRQRIAPNLGGTVELRPLLDDLCQSEWELAVREPARGAVQFDLAVRLDNTRAQMWQDTLKPVCAAWKQTSATHFAHIFRGGNWLLLQMGNVPVPPPSGTIAPLKDSWFKADINWRLLAGWFPGLAKFDLPNTHLEVAGKDGNFEVNGKLYLARPLPPPPQWQFPTNSILGPFISFTAARGVSSWLQQQPWAVATGLNPLPDQVFAWALPGLGFETLAAVPMPDPVGALPKLAQAATPVLHDINTRSPLSELSIIATNNQVTFTGMPYIAPYLKAEAGRPRQLPAGGIFPQCSPRQADAARNHGPAE